MLPSVIARRANEILIGLCALGQAPRHARCPVKIGEIVAHRRMGMQQQMSPAGANVQLKHGWEAVAVRIAINGSASGEICKSRGVEQALVGLDENRVGKARIPVDYAILEL